MESKKNYYICFDCTFNFRDNCDKLLTIIQKNHNPQYIHQFIVENNTQKYFTYNNVKYSVDILSIYHISILDGKYRTEFKKQMNSKTRRKINEIMTYYINYYKRLKSNLPSTKKIILKIKMS